MYSQLQTILPDSFLGDISDWDRFLSIDLSSDLPFKSVTDFLRNKDFADLVNKSDLPTSTHFVEQALRFYKSLCTLLLKHSIRKSKFIRGTSVFDEAVILHGREEDYEEESDQLCDFLIQRDWISSSIKPLILSEYRSFVEKFRSCEVQYDTDWVTFMSGYYELQCRTNLLFVFKLCCLEISSSICIPPVFTVALPDLASDNCNFTSAVRSVQSSLVGIPNVLGLFSNPRTVAPIFSLLGKGRSLLENPDYSVWDVSSSCSSRRRRLQKKFESRFTGTVTDEERAWFLWMLILNLLVQLLLRQLIGSLLLLVNRPKLFYPVRSLLFLGQSQLGLPVGHQEVSSTFCNWLLLLLLLTKLNLRRSFL